MDDEVDLLDSLLSAAADELLQKPPESNKTKQLKEIDLFQQPIDGNKSQKSRKPSIIHAGDTDSSEDEDNKYFEEQKFNSYGKDIKHLLSSGDLSDNSPQRGAQESWKKPNTTTKQASEKNWGPPIHKEAHFDPVFGLRIVNPLVSSVTLKERMVGREAVPFFKIKNFVKANIADKNWVIGAVIVSKSSVRTSQKGSQFLIWTLSDLKDDIKTVSMFLFGNAYKNLWKTPIGTVVGVLNPSVLDKKDGSKDEACLSVDNSQKVMILGQSKDSGTCKSVKKDGNPCTAIVNLSRCEYCVYHIKQEYQKCSQRSDLQSSFSGKGLTALRNKVLGKNEVFYAGQLYTAIPAKKNKKLEQRDQKRLAALQGLGSSGSQTVAGKTPKKKQQYASNLDVPHKQKMRDLQLLEKLGGSMSEGRKQLLTDVKQSSGVTLESSKESALSVISKLKAQTPKPVEQAKNESKVTEKKVTCFDSPILTGNKIINLDAPISSNQVTRAKLNALKFVQKNGPLKKDDPNRVKSIPHKKRLLEKLGAETEEPCAKKKKPEPANDFTSERFKKIMEAQSKHNHLLEKHDNEEKDKYFNKLEAKERMEEKMSSTFKAPCKAVMCVICKYTNFSASQKCKDEKHPLRVFDTMKRFFKCGRCGNRTVSLDIIPTSSCNNCGSGKWERTGMMKEKIVTAGPTLSIRGGEQQFVNSIAANSNIDLLVPEEES